MMKRMSFSETVFLFVLALMIFGPKKLPEIARQAGKLLGEFRRASNEFKAQIEQEIAHLEVESRKPTILSPSSAPAGTASRTPALATGAESHPSVRAEAAAASTGAEIASASAIASEPISAVSPAALSQPAAGESTSTPEAATSTTAQESHV